MNAVQIQLIKERVNIARLIPSISYQSIISLLFRIRLILTKCFYSKIGYKFEYKTQQIFLAIHIENNYLESAYQVQIYQIFSFSDLYSILHRRYRYSYHPHLHLHPHHHLEQEQILT